MTHVSPCHDIKQVCTGLTKAWKFLCGEERSFALSTSCRVVPPLTEFSYFMQIKVSEDRRTCGMGVLIERPDAVNVASHMFGVAAACLKESDLHDACAEVCNLFSGCVALHISDNAGLQMGLPFLVSRTDYEQIAARSTVASVYVSKAPNVQLYVVEYHIFSQPY